MAKLIGNVFRHGAQSFLTKNSFYKMAFKSFASHRNRMKVTVLGAGGHLGRSVSLMLKQSPFIDELCLFDQKCMGGFANDLNYVDTHCNVTAYVGLKDIKPALCNAQVVVILTSTQNSYLDYDNLFEKNATMIQNMAVNVAQISPKALIAIAVEPINSIIPMFSEIMKKQGCYNPNTVFGVTTIDVVRTNKFVAEVMGLDPECVMVPLIGGHTKETIIPVLSKATPCNNFTNEELEDITDSVRASEENLTKVRSCEGIYLSKAFAISRFVLSLLKAQAGGHGDVVECAYVRSGAHPQVKYMVTPLVLGSGGIVKNLGLPQLSDYEYCMLENAIPLLIEDIKKGECVGVGKCEEKASCDFCDPNPKAPRCPPDHCELQSMMAGNKR